VKDNEITIYIGGIHASGRPQLVKTLLGSCIAVCLFDPVTATGGMNHFMLPRGVASDGESSRFGVHAMDCLIGAMMKLGADRRRFVAKVFGGAHVLNVTETANGVPQQNVEFIREFLQNEGFPILSADVGGYHPRHVHFYTTTGRAFIKRLGAETRARLLKEEQALPVAAAPPVYGDVTLF
jgi:chemotaxis receptor (MCP) glutamine deamidase CheD